MLAPGGRLVIVVPNRRGVWARFEHTPFGTGRPFSRGQLTELLRETNFTPGAWTDGAVLPAVAAPLGAALPPAAGTQRPPLLADVFRRHRRRGAEAALPGPAGHPARLAPRLRAGADAARGDAGRADRAAPLTRRSGDRLATAGCRLTCNETVGCERRTPRDGGSDQRQDRAQDSPCRCRRHRLSRPAGHDAARLHGVAAAQHHTVDGGWRAGGDRGDLARPDHSQPLEPSLLRRHRAPRYRCLRPPAACCSWRSPAAF